MHSIHQVWRSSYAMKSRMQAAMCLDFGALYAVEGAVKALFGIHGFAIHSERVM